MSQKIKTSVEIDGSLKASQIANATTDTDKFLVSDDGTIKYRTGAEMLSDLGVSLGTASKIQHQVKAGVAINKGQAVYVTSADGTNMIVGLASNVAESSSSKTMGLLNATVSANGFADVIAEGLLSGLDTSTAIVGNPVWLGTNGNLIYGLANKPSAPSHLVFIGIVTRVNANNGEIFVKVQNGFELDELHDVDLKSTTPSGNDILAYEGNPVNLWKNKSIAAVLGYTPYNASNPAGYISSYTETDPTVPSYVKSITSTEKSNWNTAFGWGNHASAGYALSGHTHDLGRYSLRAPALIDSVTSSNFRTQLFGSSTSGYNISTARFNATPGLLSGLNNYGTMMAWSGYDTHGFLAIDYAGPAAIIGGGNADNINWTKRLAFLDDTVPNNRTITINGTSYDLSANRSWTVTASETDTLQSVTNRGNTTTTSITANSIIIPSFETASNVLSFRSGIPDGTNVGIRAKATVTANRDGLELLGYNGIDFSINNGNTVAARINSVGNLGLGTLSPISGGGSARWFTVEGTSTYGGGLVSSVAGSAKAYYYYDGTNAVVQGAAGVGISFQPNNSSQATLNTSGDFTANASLRSPIFYDSNNTGYYVDPNSTSRMGTINADALVSYGVSYASGTGGFASSTYATGVRNPIWRFGNADAYGLSYFQGTAGIGGLDTIGLHFGTATASGSPFQFRSDGYAYASAYLEGGASLRAPIFYDSQNTGYYVDPSSTSYINVLQLANKIIVGSFPQLNTNTGEAWIGRAADRNVGSLTVQLGGNSASGRVFEIIDYAWTISLFNVTSGGTATAYGDIVAYSDKRVKENVCTIEGALDKVLSLRGVTYNRIDSEDKSEKIGVIAQEIQEVLPQVVHEQDNGMLGVSYGNITAVLIEAIKEQQTQIEELKQLVNQLINK